MRWFSLGLLGLASCQALLFFSEGSGQSSATDASAGRGVADAEPLSDGSPTGADVPQGNTFCEQVRRADEGVGRETLLCTSDPAAVLDQAQFVAHEQSGVAPAFLSVADAGNGAAPALRITAAPNAGGFVGSGIRASWGRASAPKEFVVRAAIEVLPWFQSNQLTVLYVLLSAGAAQEVGLRLLANSSIEVEEFRPATSTVYQHAASNSLAPGWHRLELTVTKNEANARIDGVPLAPSKLDMPIPDGALSIDLTIGAYGDMPTGATYTINVDDVSFSLR